MQSRGKIEREDDKRRVLQSPRKTALGQSNALVGLRCSGDGGQETE